MTRNRNVHSLSLMFDYAPFPQSAVIHATPSAIEQQRHEQTSSCDIQASDASTVIVKPQPLCIHPSKSSILKEGVITPVSPNFPETRKTACGSGKKTRASSGSLEGHKRYSRRLNSRGRTRARKASVSLNMPGSFPTTESPATSYQYCMNMKPEPVLEIPDCIPSPPTGALKIERYVSLSSLPTPPLTESSSSSPEPSPGIDMDDLQNPDLIGPAKYLAELIPSSASAFSASIHILQSILHRTNVRVEVVALAGIILDTLSSQFVRKWRLELSKAGFWEDGGRCEILPLVALGIAMKFLDDKACTTAWLSEFVSSDRFCPQEINLTERLILIDIDYALACLSADAEICWAVREIQRCCKRVMKDQAGKEMVSMIIQHSTTSASP